MARLPLKMYSLIGLIIILTAEVLLFSGVPVIGVWFTPIAWTGFIMFADGIVLSRTGTSLLMRYSWKMIIFCLFSIGFWLIFEGYNRLIQNWYYTGLPSNLIVRYTGYCWSFATIFPAIFEMRDLLACFGVFTNVRFPRFSLSKAPVYVLIGIGGIFILYPLFQPSEYLFPFVWTGFVFLLDPLNLLLGERSLLKELSEGKLRELLLLFLSGLLCGVLWEFWNYWSESQWHYDVPFPPNVKIFEMPLFGWLGFPPFAVECFVMWTTAKAVLKRICINF